jgi:uncharacterized protein involved in propanediol utilization
MSRCRLILAILVVSALPLPASGQGLGGLTTIDDPLSYSVYTRQQRAQRQQVQRLTQRVQTVERRAAKRLGEAAPRSGFQTQADYFQNHLR